MSCWPNFDRQSKSDFQAEKPNSRAANNMWPQISGSWKRSGSSSTFWRGVLVNRSIQTPTYSDFSRILLLPLHASDSPSNTLLRRLKCIIYMAWMTLGPSVGLQLSLFALVRLFGWWHYNIAMYLYVRCHLYILYLHKVLCYQCTDHPLGVPPFGWTDPCHLTFLYCVHRPPTLTCPLCTPSRKIYKKMQWSTISHLST